MSSYIDGTGNEQLKADFLEKRVNAAYRLDPQLKRFCKVWDCYEDIFESGGLCYGREISKMFPDAWRILSCYNPERRVGNECIDWDAIAETVNAKMDTIISDVFAKYTRKRSVTRADGYYELLR